MSAGIVMRRSKQIVILSSLLCIVVIISHSLVFDIASNTNVNTARKTAEMKYILYWNEAYDSKGEFFFFYILKTFDFMQLMQHIMFSYLHLQIDLGFRSRRASVSQSVRQSVRNPR